MTDVAIVGAGPYGLSVAAHLRRSGLSVRQFGRQMHLWRASMPRGMYLKSQGFASSLSDPEAAFTLAAFCGRPAARTPTTACRCRWTPSSPTATGSSRRPAWRSSEVMVTGLAQQPGGYRLSLADGETVTARQVVLAIGVEHFAYLPGELSGLPASPPVRRSFGAHRPVHVPRPAGAGRRAGQSALRSVQHLGPSRNADRAID